MKEKLISLFALLSLLGCSESSESGKKDFKVLSDAFRSGHLTIVKSILSEKKESTDLSEDELFIYLKTLFYSGDWKDFFIIWSELKHKTPEMVLLYFKAVLLSKEKIVISEEDEKKLFELVSVSPEACLLLLRIQNGKTSTKQKQLFLAQTKHFQTHLDRLQKEMGDLK
ncbi:hypothetical protein EHQ68_00455 [Leptospira congkakensis]|uniref:Lipoprotein n=1 Tax=Leptospira congkakensis TaxID=2484932 RepID=A0A4Z1A969_9LEPT|nr:hypothetical protein [Leptospira congkakensis]TGL87866.1 hypothetical protein EHQ69_17390 [Leptospira congkakensis]TGL92643.1 hypothetical protein EHQ68_00455 [Leptospira congkakensis]TGL96016.1 hypothetical protein EHQ70_13060 [Leptospira congkakensis]